MGYWDDASSFSEAGEALARRLLAFADASNERVLDIAHGPGDSLLLHLESNPKHLTAIASLPSDTETAQQRVNQWFLEHAGKTDLTWYTGSATFRPAKDFDHPLYPMRGFLGDSNVVVEEEEEEREQVVFDDEADVVDVEEVVLDKAKSQTGIDLYDLVYVLDALYHFPPSRSAFIASVLPNLRPGGVLAYTDILAPPSLSRLPGRLLANLLSTLLRVPQSNLASGITLNQYKSSLEDMGYKVQLQDWTTHVFPGFAANLKARGAGWWVVGWLAEKAEASGWKYVAVRAERSST